MKIDPVSKIKLLIYFPALILLAYGLLPCIGKTYDSTLYLELSEHLVESGLIQDSFKAKPPLYSIILFTLKNSSLAISVLNLTCWIISMYLFESILSGNQFHQTKSFEILQSIWIACSTPIFLTHNFIWTEPLFLVLILLFFQKLNSQHRNKYIILTVIALLAVALRHLGILIIMGSVITLIYSGKFRKRDLIWSLTAFGFFTIWQGFVYYLRADLGRMDHFSGVSLPDNYLDLGKSLGHWIYPFEFSPLHYIIPVIIVSLILYSFVIFRDLTLKAIAAASILNIIMIITKGDLIYEDIERYLFFVHPFLLPFVFAVSGKHRFNRIIVNGFLILLILYTLVRTIKNSLFWYHAFCLSLKPRIDILPPRRLTVWNRQTP